MIMENVVFCIVYIMLFFFAMWLQKVNFRTYRTPITFFSVLWTLVGFVANIGVLEFYYPSLLVNICITFGVIVFTLTYIGMVKPRTIIIFSKFEFDENEVINYQLIYILMGIGLVFLIPSSLKSIRLINQYGMVVLRANLTNQDLGVSRGALWDNFYTYGVNPIFIATSILSSVLIFTDQPKRKVIPLFAISILSLVLMAVSKASRVEFVRFFFCLLVSLLICRRQVLRNMLKNKIIRRGLTFAAAIVLIITFQRANSDRNWWENLLRTVYIYYFSGPSYMTQILKNVTEYGPTGRLLFGTATFGFVSNFISFALTVITGQSRGSLYLLGSKLTNVPYFVGSNVRVNAMSTCFYNFLLDWSYLGIFLGPFILAAFASHFTKKLYKLHTIRSMCLYVFFLYILFRTCFKLELVSISFSMTCIYLMLFCRDPKKKVFKSKKEE